MSPGFVFYVKFEYNRNVQGGGRQTREQHNVRKKKMDGLQMFLCVCVFREKKEKDDVINVCGIT